MELFFYFFGIISVISTILVLFNTNPMHALLYFIVSIVSIAGIFFSLGAFFPGVIEVIIYAGAIMVLFVFFIMILNLGEIINDEEKKYFQNLFLVIPIIFSFLLFMMVIYFISFLDNKIIFLGKIVEIKRVGFSLLGMYTLLVETASLILLSALIVTLHFSKKK